MPCVSPTQPFLVIQNILPSNRPQEHVNLDHTGSQMPQLVLAMCGTWGDMPSPEDTAL